MATSRAPQGLPAWLFQARSGGAFSLAPLSTSSEFTLSTLCSLKRTDNRLTSVAPVNDLLSDTATAQTCAFQGSQYIYIYIYIYIYTIYILYIHFIVQYPRCTPPMGLQYQAEPCGGGRPSRSLLLYIMYFRHTAPNPAIPQAAEQAATPEPRSRRSLTDFP
jgi:hypothetical protein